MVDFAGWEMPIQYSSIIAEHQATRTAVTLFDVSHMGRILISGSGAEAFIDRLATRKVAKMGAGRIRYSLVCNESGGILDDILVYRLPDTDDQYMLVVNASNREKILAWIQQQLSGSQPDAAGGEPAVEVTDTTFDTAMIAIQGPGAVELVNPFLASAAATGESTDFNLGDLKYFQCRNVLMANQKTLISRTGYTGEDGCEIIVPNQDAAEIWEKSASQPGVMAAGLGARDTLRLEAAMPLYGHELSETINAAQTGLDFAITLKDRDFIGKSAIESAKNAGDLDARIGLLLEGKRAAREGSSVLDGETVVGEVTSGTFSPTLQKPIAMAYVKCDHTKPGTTLSVDIRGKKIPATVCELPFYSR